MKRGSPIRNHSAQRTLSTPLNRDELETFVDEFEPKLSASLVVDERAPYTA